MRFDHPVVVTGFILSDAGSPEGTTALVRLWARDLTAYSSGRFAPLNVTSSLTCSKGQSGRAKASEVGRIHQQQHTATHHQELLLCIDVNVPYILLACNGCTTTCLSSQSSLQHLPVWMLSMLYINITHSLLPKACCCSCITMPLFVSYPVVRHSCGCL